jgi:ketosteroid isomerase-like protein
MTPSEVVREYWTRMEARDWDGVRTLLAPDVVVEWTSSGERFVGPDNVVAVNAGYPPGWSIRIRSIVADGGTVVSDLDVPMAGVGDFRAACFARVADGLITESVEYWIGVGVDEPAAWRAQFSEPRR